MHTLHTLKTKTTRAKQNPFFGKGEPMPFFQPKLTVNTPGDEHEQEADRVADQVMRMREGDAPVVQRMALTPVGTVMRACSECEKEKVQRKEEEEETIQRKEEEEETVQRKEEEEETVQRKEEEEETIQRKEEGEETVQRKEEEEETIQRKEEEEETVQRKEASGRTTPSIVSEVLSSGGGQPMEMGTQQFMESRFGQDFSQVRVHTDGKAAESASAIQARAYTSGNNIVFGNGEYRPSSSEGRRLLAHELVHVGQQGGGKPGPIVQRGWLGKVWSGIKKGASAIGKGIKAGVKAIGSGAKWLGSKVWGGLKWLGGKVWEGMKWLGLKVWAGLKWLGHGAWEIIKWLGSYLGRVGVSAFNMLWSTIVEFPMRFWRLIKHLGSALISVPVWFWRGIKLLFAGDWAGLGKWAWSGFKSAGAWVLRLIAKVLDLAGLGEWVELLWTIIKVNTRGLTDEEKTEAKKVFGSSISYWKVRIDEASLIAVIGNLFGGHKGGGMGVTTFHTINFNKSIDAKACNSDMRWLIHELTHVAQYESVGMQYLGEALAAQAGTGYGYGGGAGLSGKNLKDFNREQQGDIVADYYNLVLCAGGSHPHATDYLRMIADLQQGKM